MCSKRLTQLVPTPEFLHRLLFRRQFVLGPTPFAPTRHWSSLPLPNDIILSIHEDLHVFSASSAGVTVTLIGVALDPLNPERAEADIVRSLLENGSSIRELINSSRPLAGRWIIICQNHEATYLFTDPCGFRQVFYFSDGHRFWCGSQPEIINANCTLDLNTNDKLQQFLLSPKLSRTESAWVGSQTLYKDCFHLLPNHYLDVNNLEPIRFFPNVTMPLKPASSIIESASSILRGTIEAITKRQNVLMALTAGWDTRVLLAASREVSANIQYFVDRHGVLPEDHPDVWVPGLLAEKLGINLVVKNSVDELPGWFVTAISRNVTGARILPKSRMIYDKFIGDENRLNINGNASEICRNYFDKYCKIDPKNVTAPDLVGMLGYDGLPFVREEIHKWRSNLNPYQVNDVNVLDMLHWEQRIGNWGAQYPAEQDIAIEEVSPFNCRLLIETLLSSPRHLRAAPDYPLYTALIQKMWPEALSVPINPSTDSPAITLNFDLAGQQVRGSIPEHISVANDESRISPVYEGYHDIADCRIVGGWVRDKTQPDVRLNVNIYADSTLLAIVTADKFRQDLADAGKGDGRHGFHYEVPLSLRDGKPHSILVKVSGSDFNLTSTPKVITCELQTISDIQTSKDKIMNGTGDKTLSIVLNKIKEAYFRILYSLKADFNQLTIVVPYRKTNDPDREMHLEITLRYLSKIGIPNLIISEHSDISIKDFLISSYANFFKSFEVVHTNAHSDLFNISKAINKGVKEATTPFVALSDIDCLTKKKNINLALAMLNRGYDVVHPFDRRVTDIVDKEIFMREYDFSTVTSPEQRRPWADGGIVFWNKHSFVSIGMKNEYFSGWGGEDNEIMVRADLCQLKQHRIDDTLYHLYHYRPQEENQNNIDQLKKTEQMKNKDECMKEVNKWPWVIETKKKFSCQ
jgi:hypothetical protein